MKAGAPAVMLGHEVEVVLVTVEQEAGRSLCLMIREHYTSHVQLTFGLGLCKRDLNFHLGFWFLSCLFFCFMLLVLNLILMKQNRLVGK